MFDIGTWRQLDSINRNILECKDEAQKNRDWQAQQVLIETYWNVKMYVGNHVLMLLEY